MQESKLFFHSSECSQKGGNTQRQGAMLFLIIEQPTISVWNSFCKLQILYHVRRNGHQQPILCAWCVGESYAYTYCFSRLTAFLKKKITKTKKGCALQGDYVMDFCILQNFQQQKQFWDTVQVKKPSGSYNLGTISKMYWRAHEKWFPFSMLLSV